MPQNNTVNLTSMATALQCSPLGILIWQRPNLLVIFSASRHRPLTLPHSLPYVRVEFLKKSSLSFPKQSILRLYVESSNWVLKVSVKFIFHLLYLGHLGDQAYEMVGGLHKYPKCLDLNSASAMGHNG